MKKDLLSFFTAISIIISGCSKNETTTSLERDINEQQLSEIEAYNEFASILSKAVNNETALRLFLKKEALKQFDKDYDVFYPWLRDCDIDGNNSFEEILKKYDDKNLLERITETIPKLTIMIPDWEWLGAFSVLNWDTNDSDVAVGFASENSTIKVFEKGEYVGKVEQNQIPSFPILLIKENERMKEIKAPTRSSIGIYDFADDEFNNSYPITTRISWKDHYSDQIYTLPEPNNNVTAAELDPAVLKAFEEFGDENYYYQRDYIYYGMTKQIDSGRFNPKYKEYLYKIKFSDALNDGLYESGDGSFPDEYENKGSEKSVDELRKLDFRIDGNLDLRFNVLVGDKSGSLSCYTFAKSINMKDLFDYDRVHINMRHKTWVVWRRKYVYNIDKQCLKPKWFTIDKPLPIPLGDCWNLASKSSNIKINVEEWDSGNETEKTFSSTFTIAQNTSSETTTSGDKTSSKYGYGISSSAQTKNEVKIKSTDKTDDFGDAIINYLNTIIKKKNEDGSYEIYVYTTGTVDMMIFPRRN